MASFWGIKTESKTEQIAKLIASVNAQAKKQNEPSISPPDRPNANDKPDTRQSSTPLSITTEERGPIQSSSSIEVSSPQFKKQSVFGSPEPKLSQFSSPEFKRTSNFGSQFIPKSSNQKRLSNPEFNKSPIVGPPQSFRPNQPFIAESKKPHIPKLLNDFSSPEFKKPNVGGPFASPSNRSFEFSSPEFKKPNVGSPFDSQSGRSYEFSSPELKKSSSVAPFPHKTNKPYEFSNPEFKKPNVGSPFDSQPNLSYEFSSPKLKKSSSVTPFPHKTNKPYEFSSPEFQPNEYVPQHVKPSIKVQLNSGSTSLGTPKKCPFCMEAIATRLHCAQNHSAAFNYLVCQQKYTEKEVLLGDVQNSDFTRALQLDSSPTRRGNALLPDPHTLLKTTEEIARKPLSVAQNRTNAESTNTQVTAFDSNTKITTAIQRKTPDSLTPTSTLSKPPIDLMSLPFPTLPPLPPIPPNFQGDPSKLMPMSLPPLPPFPPNLANMGNGTINLIPPMPMQNLSTPKIGLPSQGQNSFGLPAVTFPSFENLNHFDKTKLDATSTSTSRIIENQSGTRDVVATSCQVHTTFSTSPVYVEPLKNQNQLVGSTVTSDSYQNQFPLPNTTFVHQQNKSQFSTLDFTLLSQQNKKQFDTSPSKSNQTNVTISEVIPPQSHTQSSTPTSLSSIPLPAPLPTQSTVAPAPPPPPPPVAVKDQMFGSKTTFTVAPVISLESKSATTLAKVPVQKPVNIVLRLNKGVQKDDKESKKPKPITVDYGMQAGFPFQSMKTVAIQVEQKQKHVWSCTMQTQTDPSPKATAATQTVTRKRRERGSQTMEIFKKKIFRDHACQTTGQTPAEVKTKVALVQTDAVEIVDFGLRMDGSTPSDIGVDDKERDVDDDYDEGLLSDTNSELAPESMSPPPKKMKEIDNSLNNLETEDVSDAEDSDESDHDDKNVKKNEKTGSRSASNASSHSNRSARSSVPSGRESQNSTVHSSASERRQVERKNGALVITKKVVGNASSQKQSPSPARSGSHSSSHCSTKSKQSTKSKRSASRSSSTTRNKGTGKRKPSHSSSRSRSRSKSRRSKYRKSSSRSKSKSRSPSKSKLKSGIRKSRSRSASSNSRSRSKSRTWSSSTSDQKRRSRHSHNRRKSRSRSSHSSVSRRSWSSRSSRKSSRSKSNHSSPDRGFLCDVCKGGPYNNAKLVAEHEVSAHGAAQADFPCCWCNFKAPTTGQVVTHMTEIHQYKTLVLRCGFCKEKIAEDIRDKNDEGWEDLRKHMEMEYLKNRIYSYERRTKLTQNVNRPKLRSFVQPTTTANQYRRFASNMSSMMTDRDKNTNNTANQLLMMMQEFLNPQGFRASIAPRGQGVCPHGPAARCKNFPDCPGALCYYSHGPCRYDARCNKIDCPYDHSGKPRVCLTCLRKNGDDTSSSSRHGRTHSISKDKYNSDKK